MKVKAILVLVVALCVAADKPKVDAKKELKSLQGTWEMVGLEVNVVKLPSGPAIKSARAVFLVGDKESYGEWRGPAADANAEKVRLVAKPGYAVGAISARHLPFLFGLSVTFMKVKDGKLDPTDKYESEWAGAKDGLGIFFCWR